MIEIKALSEFADFLNTAKPGTSCMYHLGELARDCTGKKGSQVALSLARAAYLYQVRGMVRLTQRRFNEGVYAYIATRTDLPAQLAPTMGDVMRFTAQIAA